MTTTLIFFFLPLPLPLSSLTLPLPLPTPSWCPNVTTPNLLETGKSLQTTLLLLPLRDREDAHDTYQDFLRGKFDLSCAASKE